MIMYKGGLKIGNLESRYPIIQGGMGVGISLSGLAGAVAAAGGIGIISTAQIGYREEDYDTSPLEANLRAIGKEIQKAKEIANGGIVGVNIMVATQHYADYVKEACRQGADIIISGAGLPVSLPELAGGDAKLAPIVSSAKAAMVICKMWDRKYHRVPDLVVIEGPEAGGHLGFSREELDHYTEESYDTEILKIFDVVKTFEQKYETKIPIAVAGGIYNREKALHYFELGADAIQVATRFVTTEECDAAIEYKNAYINAKKEDIVIVKSPVGMPGRAIKNKFMADCMAGNRPKLTKCHQCIITCKKETIPYCITDALVNAAKGNVDQALLFCGAQAWRAEKIQTVNEVIHEFFPK
ncbi:MAG: nitronate monooxygenase family protein [Clostridiales bacterium]|nr:nitronate monooxygenase family protein [Clostridiales bacterium]